MKTSNMIMISRVGLNQSLLADQNAGHTTAVRPASSRGAASSARRREHTEHYDLERNHQGLENELTNRCRRDFRGNGPVECRERLGGILRYYRRAA
jgi:hypothetical protein